MATVSDAAGLDVSRAAIPRIASGSSSRWALVVLVYCVFSFKIAIIHGYGNGIRIDDFMLAIAAVALILGWLQGRGSRFSAVDRALLAFVGIGLATALVAYVAGRIQATQGVLFALRPLEYWIVYRLAKRLDERDRGRFAGVLQLYAWFVAILSMGQVAGVLGGVTGFALSRASANLGGPYELAAVSAGLVVWFAHRRQWGYAALSCVPLILSESRSTVVAVIVVAPFLARALDWRARCLAVSATAFALMALIFTLGVTESTASTPGGGALAGRLQRTSFVGAWSAAGAYTATAPPTTTQPVYEYYAYSALGEDVRASVPDSSALIRYIRWQLLLRATFHSASTIIYGLGPSFAGLAVDGNYVRTFAESGLVGLAALIIWLLAMWRSQAAVYLRSYLLVLAATAVFIDIFVSYKACLFLWVFLALAASDGAQTIESPAGRADTAEAS
jgi:hypothetical protein